MTNRLKKTKIVVERDPMDLRTFDLEYGHTEDHRSLREKARDACVKVSCKRILKSVGQELYSLVPIIKTLKNYKWKHWIFSDVMAGISVGMVHIPTGMGFAVLTALAPVYGLYAAFWQVLFYMLLGNCRRLSIGSMAMISLMIGPIVERETELWRSQLGNALSRNETYTTMPPLYLSTTSELVLATSVQPLGNSSDAPPFEGLTAEDKFRSSVANGVSLIVGLTMFVMGMLKLGILRAFMPPSLISGFTTAASFHITTTQLKGLFNVKVKRYGGMFNLPRSVFEFLKALSTANPADVICSVICFIILLFIKEFINVKFRKKLKTPIPTEMIIVVLGSLLSYLIQFNARWGIKVVGFIPVGIPPPAMPNLEHADTYILEGIVIGITSFAVSISMVEILTTKHKYLVDPNKELIAYGLTYGISSFFHCFAGAAAPPRCILMDNTGGKSQVASFFTVILLLLVLLVIGPVFRYLPSSCLACIIIVALIPLYKQFSILPKLWRLNKPDLLIWIVTFLVSVIVDISVSLGVGIVFSIFISILPSMFAKGYRLGTTGHDHLLAPLDTHIKVTKQEEIAVFRYENTLHYLTIKNFKEELFNATIDPRDEESFKHLTKVAMNFLENQQKAAQDNPAYDKHSLGKDYSEDLDSEGHANGDVPGVQQSHVGRRPSYCIPDTVSLKLRAIILDCSPIGYIDLLGIDTLNTLLVEFDKMNIKFTLADCNPNLIRKLKIAGLTEEENEGFLIFPTVQDGLALLSDQFKPRKESLPKHRLSKSHVRSSSNVDFAERKESHTDNRLSNGGGGVKQNSLYLKRGSRLSSDSSKDKSSSLKCTNINNETHSQRSSLFEQRGGIVEIEERKNSFVGRNLSNSGVSLEETDKEREITEEGKNEPDIEEDLRTSTYV